ncbi:MAG TPA: DUF2924 domain-containing protein [Henriciella marina]|uniref:DUF2924 domain-containing protein n=1 Tax=Henriciella sp. TaxID=1968823 RepID=UPI0017BCFB2B|nr:DUF2924 domain-containing protein [Henriciella sp.]HIG21821.1 DUF2924 domain-containing protein [Henriciella sp.]HIK64589.1 DUF2924 domain-containing protein [Henriciella marina]
MRQVYFESLSRDELIECWTEMIGSAPPPKLRSPMMVKVLTCEQQWQVSGQPRAALVKKLRRRVGETTCGAVPACNGQRLVREWNGVEHTVDITEAGYFWNGKIWRSLSAIAKEITGTKWSGPRFFGVQT